MSVRLLIGVFAVTQIVSGIACVVAPSMMLESFGVSFPPIGLVIYQFWGASMAAVGVLCWLIRDVDVREKLMPILVALFVLNVTNGALAVRGQGAGANPIGWLMVLVYALFALAFLSAAFKLIRLHIRGD